jgi:hypothetical protein
VIKGGFDRKTLFQQVESGFDKLFGYQRDLQETFVYCNTMKNGSIEEQIRMQERMSEPTNSLHHDDMNLKVRTTENQSDKQKKQKEKRRGPQK